MLGVSGPLLPRVRMLQLRHEGERADAATQKVAAAVAMEGPGRPPA